MYILQNESETAIIMTVNMKFNAVFIAAHFLEVFYFYDKTFI